MQSYQSQTGVQFERVAPPRQADTVEDQVIIAQTSSFE